MDRCRTIKGVHVPGCYGCAANGHAVCTCERSSRQTVESRYNDALRKIAEMGTADMTQAGFDLREAIGLARDALKPQGSARKKKARPPAGGEATAATLAHAVEILRQVNSLIVSDPTMEAPHYRFRNIHGPYVEQTCQAVREFLLAQG